MKAEVLSIPNNKDVVAYGSMVRSHGKCDWMRSGDGVIVMRYHRGLPNHPKVYYARLHKYIFKSEDVKKLGYPIMTTPTENMAWEIESEYLKRTTGKGLESQIKLIANRDEDMFTLLRRGRR